MPVPRTNRASDKGIYDRSRRSAGGVEQFDQHHGGEQSDGPLPRLRVGQQDPAGVWPLLSHDWFSSKVYALSSYTIGSPLCAAADQLSPGVPGSHRGAMVSARPALVKGSTRTLSPYLAAPPLENSILPPIICGR
eukprot:958202-Prorocentrum_minimum.AAC.3